MMSSGGTVILPHVFLAVDQFEQQACRLLTHRRLRPGDGRERHAQHVSVMNVSCADERHVFRDLQSSVTQAVIAPIAAGSFAAKIAAGRSSFGDPLLHAAVRPSASVKPHSRTNGLSSRF